MRLAAQWTDSYPVAEFWFIWSDKLGFPDYPTVYITNAMKVHCCERMETKSIWSVRLTQIRLSVLMSWFAIHRSSMNMGWSFMMVVLAPLKFSFALSAERNFLSQSVIAGSMSSKSWGFLNQWKIKFLNGINQMRGTAFNMSLDTDASRRSTLSYAYE